jgi:hypothetical protein
VRREERYDSERLEPLSAIKLRVLHLEMSEGLGRLVNHSTLTCEIWRMTEGESSDSEAREAP